MEIANKNIKTEYFFLRLLTFIRYFGDCFFYGFFTLFLNSRGLSESTIGMVTAITPIVTLALNPFWNFLSKNANTNRKIMMVITVLEGIFIILFTQVSMLEFICLMTALVAVVGSPFYNLLDGFSETYASTYHKKYANIRYWGTFGYIIATIAASFILGLNHNHYETLLLISGLCFISVSFLWILVKPIDLSLTKGGEEVKRDYKAVLKNKTFWFYIFIYLVCFVIPNSSDSYIGLFFTGYVGLDPSAYSLIFSLILFMEFLVMFIISKLKINFNPSIAWLVAGLCHLVRALVFFLPLPVPVIVLASLLRGVAMGLILTANVASLKAICGIENVTAGLFILAIGGSVVISLANIGYGSIISHFGYPTCYFVIFSIALIGNIVQFIYALKHHFKF